MMPHERRLNIRKPLDQIAYLSLPPNNGGIVQDVSEGGLGFRAIAPLEGEGPIQFRFSIDSTERIRAVGELAWIDETRRVGGLRFTQLSDEIREQIRVWAGLSKVSILDIPVIQPAIKEEVASNGKSGLATAKEIPAAAPAIAAEVTINRKPDPTPVLANRNPLISNLKSPIYSGLSNSYSMFALEEDSNGEATAVAMPQSAVMRHPIAAVGLTIALAFFVSVGIFTYLSTSGAGESLFEWGEKMWVGNNTQPVPGDPAPSMNAAPDSSSLPQH
jgi:hypothetical protein